MAGEGSTRNQAQERRLKPRSEMWQHFSRETDDDGKEIARCKRCRQVYAYHGTKNLKKHYDKGCESADAGAAEEPPQVLPALAQDEGDMIQQQQQLPLLPPAPLPPSGCDPSSNRGSSERDSSGSMKEEASKHLARMIALGGYDASFLEDHWFKSFVRSINPEFEVPSRDAIENMCDGISDEARRDILDRLRRAPGKVSLAVGRAKPMEEQILYVACHFIDDEWNLHKRVLHAVITADYRGVAEGTILGLDVWTDNIDDHIYEVTTDYGINDRLFTVAYETTNADFHDMMHGYSLWPGLSLTNPNRRKKYFNTYVDNVLHSLARCFLPELDFISRELVDDMEDLHLIRQERLEFLAKLGPHYGWAYNEEWYACYYSFEVLRKKGSPVQPISYEEFTPLCKVWEKIFGAIQKISSSTHPTANLCLVELFKLMEVLDHRGLEWSSSGDDEWSSSGDDEDVIYHNSDDDIDLTLHLGNKAKANDILDDAIEDFYLAWSLPLALDPRYKLKFITSIFKRLYGLEAAKQYVSKVTTMITERYTDYFRMYSAMTDGAHEMELDRYLNDPLVSQAEEGFDILNWWKAHSHSSEYPMVARMARDALAMPTCSKPSSEEMAQVRSILRGYSKKP